MWSGNIKLWIVLTIFHTGKSQYVEYYGNPGAIMFPGPIQSSYNQKINDNPQLSTSTKCQSTISVSKIFSTISFSSNLPKILFVLNINQ